MFRKGLIGVLILVAVVVIGVFVRARAILGQDGLRGAVASQISRALGQPVNIDALDWSVFPRVTLSLQGVRIGDPAHIEARTLDLATSLGALFRRRIEHASVRLDGVRIELPLPERRAGHETDAGSPSADAPVEIVSIDDITLRDVEIVSGGRILKGDVDVALQANGLVVRRVTLSAEGMAVDVAGNITDLSGPVGTLALKADVLDFHQLMAFASDFSAGLPASDSPPAASGSAAPAPRASGPGMNLTMTMEAARATFGTLALDNLSGRLHATEARLTLDPVAFGVFGGRYEGTLALIPGSTPAFDLEAALSGVNVAEAMAFAGTPGLMTGTLSARLDLAGRGLDAASVLDSARGSMRMDATDGTVSNLGLLRAVVLAASVRGRAGAAQAAASRDEPFTRLGATWSIAGGSARTTDLRFESANLTLTAAGNMALDGSAINLQGQVQLSEALTKEAGTDLVRYTAEGGRVTLPAAIMGSAASPAVRIDLGAVAGRAIRNRATEEAQKAIGRGLGGLLR